MKAIVCTGLFLGDEGKGSVVSHLAEDPDVRVVVRHNGGCQAAHNVITQDGRHHTFSQFGSGTFSPGVRTHLSHWMMVNPFNLYREEEHLRSLGVTDAWERLTVDRDCLVTTPTHAQANLLRERLRGENKHGTCGVGIGETRWWHEQIGDGALFVRDLHYPKIVEEKMGYLVDAYEAEFGVVLDMPETPDLDLLLDFTKRATVVPRDALKNIVGDGTVIFEGAQGVLLDEEHGFQPHTTWSATTSRNARAILWEDLDYNHHDAIYLGVTRTYSTRHGAGPFPPGDCPLEIPELHNGSDGPQGAFRTGPWDAVIAEYVRSIDPPTHLAITHCDWIDDWWPVIYAGYNADFSPMVESIPGNEALWFISETMKAPMMVRSYGPGSHQKYTRTDQPIELV